MVVAPTVIEMDEKKKLLTILSILFFSLQIYDDVAIGSRAQMQPATVLSDMQKRKQQNQ